ncbi:hypothetical protein CDAR_44961 [Caerostris darwini]|uniref:receptor protein-tyrosine kinase n=1 Tax=Caerostris darwini TaxID=1538125 RepID=A0AAV4WRW4_9ARAC|nr:hypothetical protein CDAR_44961 [Caerostris darwini]
MNQSWIPIIAGVVCSVLIFVVSFFCAFLYCKNKHLRRERKTLGHQLHELEHSPNSFTRAQPYYSRASECNLHGATIETIELNNLSAPPSTPSIPEDTSLEEDDYQGLRTYV